MSYICIEELDIMKKKILRYSYDLKNEGSSFSFDHVHILWDNQINLHQQESWELSYVITGRGVRVIGDTIEPFLEGEVVLIPPNIPHCWSFDETIHDSEGKIENITITFSDKFLRNCSTSFDELSGVISAIRENKNAISFSENNLLRIQQTMTAMILETNIVGHPTIEDKKTKKMQSIYLYVMNNYQNDITLDDISKFVGMEKSSFCVFFKKMTNKSFFTFLIEYRVGSSCQMLLKTTKTISEICVSSGFQDVPYYNRMFKKINGMTPTEYRKTKLKE